MLFASHDHTEMLFPFRPQDIATNCFRTLLFIPCWHVGVERLWGVGAKRYRVGILVEAAPPEVFGALLTHCHGYFSVKLACTAVHARAVCENASALCHTKFSNFLLWALSSSTGGLVVRTKRKPKPGYSGLCAYKG